MKTTIQKWGNSHAVRIPKAFLEQLGLNENEKVEIEVNQEGIMIKKMFPGTHVTLKEHLETYFGKPFTQIEVNLQDKEMEL